MLTGATLEAMTHTDEQDHAAALNANRGPLDLAMGIEYLEARPGYGRARMPVEGNTQPFGMLHGGASVVLAESLGSIIACLSAAPLVAFGTEVSATHHRPATSGHVTATCTPLYQGRSTATYHLELVDDDGRRTCTARLTCALRPLPPGMPDPFGG